MSNSKSKVIKPIALYHHWSCYAIPKKDLNTFMGHLSYETGDLTGKIVYLMSKTISQAKLRDAGFIITRSIAKADIVLLEDIRKTRIHSYYNNQARNGNLYVFNIDSQGEIDQWLKDVEDMITNGTKVVDNNTLYKYLYKYTGDFELFNSASELLKSNTSDNVKIAMEFIANANWNNNEIYLYEIFSRYWGYMRGASYKNSISFQGFLKSLDFQYESLYLENATDYRKLCKTEEHHEWVYKKFEDQFKEELDELMKGHKIKLTKLEYEIDRSLI